MLGLLLLSVALLFIILFAGRRRRGLAMATLAVAAGLSPLASGVAAAATIPSISVGLSIGSHGTLGISGGLATASDPVGTTFSSGDITYQVLSATTVQVGDGMDASTSSGVTSVVIPGTVVNGTSSYTVTSIGDSAFEGCSSLASITIPTSVTSIGDWAFYNCSSLASITIPTSVTSIGDWAFGGCSSLASVTIPTSVTSIGQDAFEDCSFLASISVAAGNPAYAAADGVLFSKDMQTLVCCPGGKTGSITIPTSVTSIGDWAFYNCSSLASITIPTSVTSIGDWAFGGCSSLASITIPTSVTSIGHSAFEGCSSLASITIPTSVTSIGDWAFYNCSSLASVTIPTSVTSIGNGAFEGCSSLASVTIPTSVTSIGWDAFYGCSSLASVTIPTSVTSIGWDAFEDCSSLASVTIPTSVTSIGDWAFYGCSSLGTIRFDSPLTAIGGSVWTIPDQTTIIGYSSSTAKDYAVEYGRTFRAIDSPGTSAAPIEPAISTVLNTNRPTIVLIGGLWSGYSGADATNSPSKDDEWYCLYEDLKTRGFNVLIPPMSVGHPTEDTMDSMGGYLLENWTRLDTWLSTRAKGKHIVIVGHSMGGLIARGFSESFFGRQKSQVEVDGIYQIDTPNLGSPMSALGRWVPPVRWLPPVESVSTEMLDENGATIKWFNSSVCPRTTVYTRHIASDFFPNTALAGIWAGSFWSPRVSSTNWFMGEFKNEPNDGLVSLSSAEYTPGSTNQNDGGLTVHDVHGWGIRGIKELWPNADCLPPKWGNEDFETIVDDITGFANRAFARGLITTSTSDGAEQSLSVSLASVSVSDLDSAESWDVAAKSTLSLSIDSATSVPFSVEGTAALVSASSDSGTPAITVTTSSGAPVACEDASSTGSDTVGFACTPGHYVAHVALTGASAATASLNVIDTGAMTLRVSTPSQASAGSDFEVEAGVYENDVRKVGGTFTAAVNGGIPVELNDDGAGADAVAGDGVFCGALSAPTTGTADVTVRATGTDSEGVAFTRIGEQLVSVATPRASLSGSYAWHTTKGSSGKADALLLDVGVHASQDCTLVVGGTVASGGSTFAQPSTIVNLEAGADATATLSLSADVLRGLDAAGDFALSSVDLIDMTGSGMLTSIGASTPDLSGSIAPADIEYAACSIGVQGSVPTSATNITLAGEAVCTTATIGGVEVSFDNGATWYEAPEPVSGWGSNDTSWSCTFTLPEGNVSATCRALDASGAPIGGATSQCSFTVDREMPVTTAIVEPIGWSRDATITLGSSDATGSGVAATYYSINGGPAQRYSGPFKVDVENALVAFSSVDFAGNHEQTQTVTPLIDRTGPTILLDATSCRVGEAIGAMVSDTRSGVATVEMQVDGGPWVAGDSVTLPSEGTHLLVVRAYDLLGNESETTASVQVRSVLDTTAPTTSILTDPAAGLMGWNTTSVSVELFAGDDQGGSGVAATYYTLDGVQHAYSGPFAVSADGAHPVTYWSVDASGNVEAAKSATIRIDALAPVVSDDAKADYSGSASIVLSATDAGSGVASIRYSLDGAATDEVDAASATVKTSVAGTHTLSWWAVDMAGNESAKTTRTFSVTASTTTPVSATPIAGTDRYDTAIKASQDAFAAGSAKTVVIARGDMFADALGGSALAGAVKGPLLLTPSSSVPASVLTELARLGATKVYVLGGTSAVSAAAFTQLAAFNPERVSGADRYGTALAVADKTIGILGASYDGKAFMATGSNFPDALGAAPIACAKGMPLVLVKPDGSYTLPSGVSKVEILGGTAAVSAKAQTSLGSKYDRRLAGGNRYATSAAVAAYGVSQGMDWDGVGIATGTDSADALAGGAMLGAENSVMLLTAGTSLSPEAASALTANKAAISDIHFIGGTSAVSTACRNSVMAIFK